MGIKMDSLSCRLSISFPSIYLLNVKNQNVELFFDLLFPFSLFYIVKLLYIIIQHEY